ncbi:hypothetical protein OK348_00990 [Flavobacterium sp. MXW15]|uniref:Uncharacterized protein n=1 Tax=Xanthomonas chitinilytica TaxID=2989819 RepID=A0ABT3JUW1_9XANT|nr:hypothetical protein [Xanthomonas sp. H13-6]MCW4453378.1 hypothetical protein [Flavobacterium sp. MXW15]MCW4472269.1 hypothetical protein [Xanthomonas sp. H13-6]
MSQNLPSPTARTASAAESVAPPSAPASDPATAPAPAAPPKYLKPSRRSVVLMVFVALVGIALILRA